MTSLTYVLQIPCESPPLSPVIMQLTVISDSDRNEMTKKKWWWKSGIKPESRKILPRAEKDIFEKIEIHCG